MSCWQHYWFEESLCRALPKESSSTLLLIGRGLETVRYQSFLIELRTCVSLLTLSAITHEMTNKALKNAIILLNIKYSQYLDFTVCFFVIHGSLEVINKFAKLAIALLWVVDQYFLLLTLRFGLTLALKYFSRIPLEWGQWRHWEVITNFTTTFIGNDFHVTTSDHYRRWRLYPNIIVLVILRTLKSKRGVARRFASI